MRGRKWRRLAAWLAAALLIAGVGPGAAEGFGLPTPEAPLSSGRERPTPAPVEEPDNPVVDHVNFPRDREDFRFRDDARLLEIWFPNIRDADVALLTFEGQAYMIDCGDERAAVRTVLLLKQLGIRKIDLLFNTHLHHDHILGLAATDDVAKVAGIKICFDPSLTESGLKMLETAAERNIPVTEYRDGDVFTMGAEGEVQLTFRRNVDEMMTINDQSALTIVRYGNRTILFTADLEKNGQAAIMKKVDKTQLACDILKYPHHGKAPMYEPFYNALGARLAIVTSVRGREDPGQDYLVAKKLPAVYTSVKGQFTHLVTDGVTWLCEYVKVVE